MTISTPYILSSKGRDKALFLIEILIACVGGAFAFPVSYLTNSNEIIGLLLLPFVVTVRGEKRFNFIFAFLFVLCGVGTWFYHVRMFYFFSLAFFIFWLAEMLLGRLSVLSIFLLLFMSPVFYQVAVILGFPIRLQLSQLAGSVLKMIGTNIQVEGNTILLNGNDFTVDEACMGLNMVAISMLMGVFIIANQSRRARKALRLGKLIVFFAAALGLNILANLLRILTLVFLNVVPENPMHEVIGVGCLILYVLIPLYLLGKFMVDRCGHSPSKSSGQTLLINLSGRLAVMAISVILLWVGWDLNAKRSEIVPTHITLNAPGFKPEELDHEVTKLANEKILIYIKPIQEFFSGEHTPLICWKGSGYKFKNVATTRIGEEEIYFGQLTKSDETLFTAWWYDNGQTKTISQLDWRLRMAKGESKFSLINVTAADQKQLIENIKIIFRNDLFKINSEGK